MSRKFFGTDGVRGRVGEAPLTADFALRLASAAARVLAPRGGSVLIGKDTRLSGYLFESALEAGFVAAGLDVYLTGPLPTPGVAYLAARYQCAFGVVISASHNPYHDNGIKFFDAAGGKLNDELERQIEAELDKPAITVTSEKLGRARNIGKDRALYEEFCKASLPQGTSLRGLKVVVDAAHGAAYKVAPRVLADLGAQVIPIGSAPNGKNINDGCGSTSPHLMQMTVRGTAADFGIALDGDGDRLVMADHTGALVDGDQLLYVLARGRQSQGRLQGPVVGTVMSNLGLEQALHAQGIEFRRAAVGDRYVLEMLREHRGILGGETSGHILCLDSTTTGDGLIAALQVIGALAALNRTLADVAAEMPKHPQVLINVRTSRRLDLKSCSPVQEARLAVEAELADTGRVVLRASGTEPLIRVMVEATTESAAHSAASHLAHIVQQAAA